MNTTKIKRLSGYVAVAVISASVALLAARARAAGIPDAEALTYTGYLEDADGKPVAGPVAIAVELWDDVEAGKKQCEQAVEEFTPQSGRFQVTLPQECTDAVALSPNLWADVKVDGVSLGRTKLGAVPYAVEAAHAVNADAASLALEADHAVTATSATSAAKADLATNATSANSATKATDADHAKGVDIVSETIEAADGADGWVAKCLAAPSTDWFACSIAASRVCKTRGYATGWWEGELYKTIKCLR